MQFKSPNLIRSTPQKAEVVGKIMQDKASPLQGVSNWIGGIVVILALILLVVAVILVKVWHIW